MEVIRRVLHQGDGQAGGGGSPVARLTALRNAASALLDAEPAQALALARECLSLAMTVQPELNVPASQLLLGKALLATAHLPEAHGVLGQAIVGYHAVGDTLGQAEAEMLAGKVGLNLGELDAAAALLQSAISRMDGLASPAACGIQATALNHLAGVWHTQGQSEEALVALHRALDLWTELGQYSGQAHCLSNIGAMQMSLGQYSQAIEALNRAHSLSRSHLGDPRSEAFILGTLARVHHLDQDHARAISVMRAAQLAAAGTHDRVLQATMLLNLGSFCLAAGHLEDAAEQLGAALELSRTLGYRLGELSTLDSLGSLYERQGELGRAMTAHQAALEIALEIGDTQGELDAQLHLGQLRLGAGQLECAEAHLRRGLELADQSSSPRETAQVHQALAELCRERGEYRAAYDHQEQLRSIERTLFDHERDRQTRNLTIQFEVERAQHEAEVYRLRTEVEHEAREAAESLVRERTAELARAQHEVVTRLAMAAEYRDDTTGEHTRRVGRSAARIARALGWTDERASILGIAARLHDVGKIGIPDTVLLKADKLTSPEFSQMQTHTLIGARILSGGRSELLRLAEEIALTHHERWDGRGYPCGLAAQQIPLTGRIVAVADVFDALTQARPYKQAWTPEEALAEIRKQAGSHFDPEVVAVALDVLSTPLPVPGGAEPGDWSVEPDDQPLGMEDATHVLAVFEQLLVERTRELEVARREAEHSAATLSRMALTDSLTGLANRRSFEADLEAAFAQAADAQQGITLLCCDLDGLKAVNDSQGHARGDELLRCFGTHLAEVFGELGRAYRIGGDEFVVIGRSADQDGWHGHLPALIARLDAAGFPGASASIGVAHHPADADTPGGLLRVSDQRMYQDKVARRAGRSGAPSGPRIPEHSSGVH